MFDTRWKRIPEDGQVSKQILYRYSLIKERKLRLREGRSLEGRGERCVFGVDWQIPSKYLIRKEKIVIMKSVILFIKSIPMKTLKVDLKPW